MMIFHPRNETVIPTVCCLLSYLSYLVETTSQMSIALKPSFCMFFFVCFYHQSIAKQVYNWVLNGGVWYLHPCGWAKTNMYQDPQLESREPYLARKRDIHPLKFQLGLGQAHPSAALSKAFLPKWMWFIMVCHGLSGYFNSHGPTKSSWLPFWL